MGLVSGPCIRDVRASAHTPFWLRAAVQTCPVYAVEVPLVRDAEVSGVRFRPVSHRRNASRRLRASSQARRRREVAAGGCSAQEVTL